VNLAKATVVDWQGRPRKGHQYREKTAEATKKREPFQWEERVGEL